MLAILLAPILPISAGRILGQLGIPDTPLRLEIAREPEYIKMSTRVGKDTVLIQKIDAEQF